MVREINRDILKAKNGIICQQVNCQGKMGKGLALAIEEKWPIVKEKYLKVFKVLKPEQLLGRVQVVEVDKCKHLFVANLFSQFDYGNDPKTVYTNYMALCSAFLKLGMKYPNEQIYIPYKIGCGLAHGDWVKVEKIINGVFCDKQKAFICRKETPDEKT